MRIVRYSLFLAIVAFVYLFSTSIVLADKALDDAIEYVEGGGIQLKEPMKKKYAPTTGEPVIRCIIDDNRENLNIGALAPPNNLTFVKDTASLDEGSDINAVLADIAVSANTKTGLVPTSGCAAR